MRTAADYHAAAIELGLYSLDAQDFVCAAIWQSPDSRLVEWHKQNVEAQGAGKD